MSENYTHFGMLDFKSFDREPRSKFCTVLICLAFWGSFCTTGPCFGTPNSGLPATKHEGLKTREFRHFGYYRALCTVDRKVIFLSYQLYLSDWETFPYSYRDTDNEKKKWDFQTELMLLIFTVRKIPSIDDPNTYDCTEQAVEYKDHPSVWAKNENICRLCRFHGSYNWLSMSVSSSY